MFTIIISEKGGAERRETFDKNEINVGRVQGNDLMLPKGNVSKHHARLLYRDGRFIVTDLKSTNGTYVNGRKIAQATIVREGDKIYIGDFVLKLDTGSQSSAVASDEPYGQADPRTPARAPAPPPNHQPPQLSAPAMHMSGPTAMNPAVQPHQVAAPAMHPSANNVVEPPSHYPLERDPDDSESGNARGSAMPKVPAPPRIPNVGDRRVTNATAVLPNRPQPPPQVAAPQPPPPQPMPVPQPPPPVAQPQPPPQAMPQPQAQPQRPAPAPMPSRQPPRETAAQAGRRLALITLVDRVADVIDLAPLKQSPTLDDQMTQLIDRTVREQAKAMRDEGEAPEGIDLELLVRDALREFVGLGPIGPLLEDEECTEIQCMRHDYVLAARGGQAVLADASFTSEEALYRTIARLAHQSGEAWRPGELVLERRLARGATMVAIVPPAASASVLVVRKRRRVDMSLEELVRSGALSRPMATFLDHCLSARANVLVCGTQGASLLLAALASSGPSGDRIAVLQENEELTIQQSQVVSLALPDHKHRGEEAMRAAARLRPERIVVTSMAGNVAAATLDVIAEGCEGVIAAVPAPSLRQALSRLVAQLCIARPGVGIDAARELVGESFDVAVEVARLPDGRIRIQRIAELGGSDAKGVAVRDLFTTSAEGPGDGGFVASGVVPRFVNDFAARGVKVDANLFKRSVGR
jgi:pilus assembly protein CpaF